ncbi:MAG: class I SAM-dependent methyltransferase [Flavobacteriaceae bacterium]|nr:class I SAM-dependent methyltransferase [Flavobacteriaceae bacterium]
MLQKYDVQYFQCNSCRFIQTENPYWLQESYGNAISNLDIGMLMRNLFYKEITADIINALFDKKKSFLDYGGGYGLFVRLMRDEGYNFFRQDNYCDNIFAQYFDIKDFKEPANFELLTCFEVFEHLPDPQTEIALMLQYSQSILFSTSLQPAIKFNASDDWFYFSPEIGQHIAFYTKKSLQIIAAKFGLNLYSDGKDLHLLTNKKWKFNWLKYISFKKRLKYQIQGKYFNSKHSLLYNDFEHVKNLIYNTK